MSETTKCPRCGSGDKSKRGWVQPFPGFANDLCQHPWHGGASDAGQAIIQNFGGQASPRPHGETQE